MDRGFIYSRLQCCIGSIDECSIRQLLQDQQHTVFFSLKGRTKKLWVLFVWVCFLFFNIILFGEGPSTLPRDQAAHKEWVDLFEKGIDWL